MGKVKDEVSGQKPAKPLKGKPSGGAVGAVTEFFLNLLKPDLYKPMQGWYARLYTALGLGVLAAAGVYQLYEAAFDATVAWRFGLPLAAGLALAWIIFRIVHYPPFAEFLIATEAEMNKVSWTTKDDLVRATTVVLTTVLVLALYLYLVDYLWTLILQLIGVLKFGGGGGLGSTA